MKIGLKLTLAFFCVAGISMLVVGIISFNKAKKSLEKESFNKLLAVREAKEDQVEDYFNLLNKQVVLFSQDPTVVRAMKRFKTGYDTIALDLHIDDNRMSTVDLSVNDYLKKEYLPRLNSNSDVKASLESESNPSKNGRILQSLYIALNPHAIGDKCLMDDAGDSSLYSKTHKRFHPTFRKYQENFGFHDIFLVDCETGVVVYSCEKEVDFGTSLIDGPFRNTGLGKAFRAANSSSIKDSVSFEDFENYRPSYNAPESFISTPIFDGDKKIGVVVFQMPVDEINDIMTNDRNWDEVGLGKTGETYIVGEDLRIRNQARGLIEDTAAYYSTLKEIGTPDSTINALHRFGTSVGILQISTTGTKDAVGGHDSALIIDGYRGARVLSSYGPLTVEGMHWAIMSELDESEAFENIFALRNQMLIALVILLFIVAVFSIFLSRRITRPIEVLSNDAMEVSKGNFDVSINIDRKDEIGILANSFRKMQDSIRKMIEELRHINQNLEQKVLERTAEVTHQKELVESQNKEILDSINYALRLQRAILPPNVSLDAALRESFVLFKPKDIVSGDFYWISQQPDQVLVAAVDCTGHGVPGALVSMIGSNNLDRCVGEFNLRKPSDVLDKLKELVVATFESTGDDEVKDGMDIALVSIRYVDDVSNPGTKMALINYSGANNPLWIVRKDDPVPAANEDGDIFEIKADKQPIGKFDYGKPFTNHEVVAHQGDCIYIFTDGYADQFGGPQGKKFRYKTMKNLFLRIHGLPMKEQRDILDKTFEDWRGELSQIDDVCIIGIRV
ncbi:MAG TPA: SpoIIE family protein phosphatase [Bacteroidia bacterium]|jgi:serine phosphatase RsbU (regulator of sigma subunit)|nr:SpoIIE family protein phosphatase [Bacteroidia bacterium]